MKISIILLGIRVAWKKTCESNAEEISLWRPIIRTILWWSKTREWHPQKN